MQYTWVCFDPASFSILRYVSFEIETIAYVAAWEVAGGLFLSMAE